MFAMLGALAVATTGCATSSRPSLGSTSSLIYTAYERTVKARTARVLVDLGVDAPRSQSYVLAKGEVELPSSSCALTVLETGTTVHELLAGSDLYLELPAFARATGDRKPWAEVVLRSGREVGPGVAPASALTEVDPLPMLDLLQLPAKSAVWVGRRIVVGSGLNRVPPAVPGGRAEPPDPGRSGAWHRPRTGEPAGAIGPACPGDLSRLRVAG